MISRRILLRSAASAATIAACGQVRAALPTVGISLPIRSVQATVAVELQRGYEAALDGVANLQILDDESKPPATAKNIEKFADDASVIAATGIVGTPHAKLAIPIAIAGGLPLVGIRSGAQGLRDANPWVHHLRASYEDEIDKVMDTASMFGSLGILYSDDDFGKGTLAHAEKVAARKGVQVALKLPVERNGSNVKAQAATLAEAAKAGRVSACLLCLIAKPAMDSALELRGVHRLVMPIFGMSFIATSQLATSKESAFEGLSLVTPFMLARIAVEEMASSFRAQMIARKQEQLIASPTSFEGYFYGSVLADAIARGGASRKQLQAYLQQQREIPVKQVPIKFYSLRVGYRYLALLRKTGQTLRA